MVKNDENEKFAGELTNFEIIKHLILKIGHDFDGNFYEDHIDFYMCFGTCHTKKGANAISIIILLLFILDVVIFTVIKVYYAIAVFGLILLFELMLMYGIYKNKRKFILPYLIISSICIFVCLVFMILVIFAVFYPKLFLFHWVMQMFMMSNLNTSLTLLLSVIVMGISVSLLIWINWSLYVHYCYLRGKELNNQKIIDPINLENGITPKSKPQIV